MWQRITFKFTIFTLVIGLMPLVIFGSYAVQKARRTSVSGIIDGNRRIAKQLSGRIDQYLDNADFVLESLGQNLALAGLSEADRGRILRNYSLGFDEFNVLRLLDRQGKVRLSSEISPPASTFAADPNFKKATLGKRAYSQVYMTDDLIPALALYHPLWQLDAVESVLMVEIDLLHLWRLVEALKIGERGYLNVLTENGDLFATGRGENKLAAVQMRRYPDFSRLENDRAFERDVDGETYLVVSAKLPPPYDWTVTVEQPVGEAYALPDAMRRQFMGIVAAFVLGVSLLAFLIARREFIRPVGKLMTRIKDIARGDLHGRVEIKGAGEFSELAMTLNQMCEDLAGVQQELVRKENQALLGRIASSLAHDLKHPVTSVENYVKLLQIKYEDPEFRKNFADTVVHEFSRIQVFLSNMKDLAKEIPFQPVTVPPAKIIGDVLQSFAPEMAARRVVLRSELDGEIKCRMDIFSSQRIFSNLVSNAIDAMPAGGELRVAVKSLSGDATLVGAVIEITDSGIGIAAERLPRIFDELTTTKKTGLGLGLAITRKIVDQHGGKIRVESALGRGTSFWIQLPVV